jgi:pyruvate/2-oxoglutarate dehydrogenase complex dihydrolipoamide acyltransferase (E2) component
MTEEVPQEVPAEDPAGVPTPEPPAATPAAEVHAADLGVDLSTVEGTGVGGTITKPDVAAAAASGDVGPAASPLDDPAKAAEYAEAITELNFVRVSNLPQAIIALEARVKELEGG